MNFYLCFFRTLSLLLNICNLIQSVTLRCRHWLSAGSAGEGYFHYREKTYSSAFRLWGLTLRSISRWSPVPSAPIHYNLLTTQSNNFHESLSFIYEYASVAKFRLKLAFLLFLFLLRVPIRCLLVFHKGYSFLKFLSP